MSTSDDVDRGWCRLLPTVPPVGFPYSRGMLSPRPTRTDVLLAVGVLAVLVGSAFVSRSGLDGPVDARGDRGRDARAPRLAGGGARALHGADLRLLRHGVPARRAGAAARGAGRHGRGRGPVAARGAVVGRGDRVRLRQPDRARP